MFVDYLMWITDILVTLTLQLSCSNSVAPQNAIMVCVQNWPITEPALYINIATLGNSEKFWKKSQKPQSQCRYLYQLS